MRWVSRSPTSLVVILAVLLVYIIARFLPFAQAVGEYSRLAGVVVAALALLVVCGLLVWRPIARAHRDKQRKTALHPVCPKCGHPRHDIPTREVTIAGLRVRREPCPECGHSGLL